MTASYLRDRIATYIEQRGTVPLDQIDGYFADVEFIDLVEALADLEGTGTVEFVERGDGAFRLSGMGTTAWIGEANGEP